MIRLTNISKIYPVGEVKVRALDDISLELNQGEFVAIMGPSGSGKSTMMNILGCLDRPTRGTYELEGKLISSYGESRLAEIRNRKIGFVFQSFNLLPRVAAVEQVELPLMYSGTHHRRKLAIQALESVGLGKRLHHKPTQLSGGEQQRIAIARALVTNPSLILADEPTGALDTATSHEIMDILTSLNEDRGITIAFVTHEPEVAAYTRRIVRFRDGHIVSDEPNTPVRAGAPEDIRG